MKLIRSKGILAAIAMLIAYSSEAQENKKAQDIKAIKSMCGCFEVEFNFAETFQYTKDANYKPSKTKREFGLEWVELVEDQPSKLVLQHLLIVDTMIVKHWRQDWEFENTKFQQFYKDKTWKFQELTKNDVKGQWSQKVYQVDDSPRYQGTATWIHADSRHFWTNTTDAPLPRREYMVRSDYNVLKRTNKQEITKDGWIHEQDNIKMVRDDNGKDKILAKEKGVDYYTKVADSRCKASQDYWKKTAAMWKNVRTKWQSIYDQGKDLNMETKIDNQTLYEFLFNLKGDATKAQSDKIIDSFIKKG